MDWLDPRLLAPSHDLEWVATRLADGLRGGRHHAARRGRGIEFAQHRSYDRGDDVRLIDWKAFARTERLVIREAEVEADHRFWLIVDASPSMAARDPDQPRTKLDVARAVAAGLCAVAERQGDDYGLAVPGRGIVLPPGQGRAWFNRMLARLHDLTPDHRPARDESTRMAVAMQASQRTSDAVILTDAYDEIGPQVRLAHELVAHGVTVRVLALESTLERDWRYGAAADFIDLETGSRVPSHPQARREYVARRQAHFADLAEQLADVGARFDRFCTDEPWDRQLRRWAAP